MSNQVNSVIFVHCLSGNTLPMWSGSKSSRTVKAFHATTKPFSPFSPVFHLLNEPAHGRSSFSRMISQKHESSHISTTGVWKRLLVPPLLEGKLHSPAFFQSDCERTSPASQDVLTPASDLAAKLRNYRERTNTSERPVAFIAHGFGRILSLATISASSRMREHTLRIILISCPPPE
jgi:hypothetical protein